MAQDLAKNGVKLPGLMTAGRPGRSSQVLHETGGQCYSKLQAR